MSPSVIYYPQPGKAKSALVLSAFSAGCGGVQGGKILLQHPSAFFGVVGIEHLFNQARARGLDWYYGDNAYFDAFRDKYFRFSKNSFQLNRWDDPPDHTRARLLGLSPESWKKGGRNIIVAPQSEHFMALSGAIRTWLPSVFTELKKHTDRPIIVRRWSRDKGKAARSLRADLKHAYALVTHMSAAANEALMFGIPVFTSGVCAATPMASGELSGIESPKYPDGREDWVARLAQNQWTLDELRAGVAWRKLENG